MSHNERNNILDAWIQIERLSEGDFNIKENGIINLDEIVSQDDGYDFHSFFLEKLENIKNSKGGIVVYLDVFNLEDILVKLQIDLSSEQCKEKILKSKKISMALYFSKETVESKDNSEDDAVKLKFDLDKFFFTTSGYIRYNLGDIFGFAEFEEKYKNNLDSRFNNKVSDKNNFNKTMNSIFENHNIIVSNCYYKIVYNSDNYSDNLHSFFIDDLNKAKKETSNNLDRYLGGFDEKLQRINLDCKNSANNILFEEILQPSKYPLGRFPANVNYGLSFMQQVAVNLVLDDSTNHLRSINGPPGTGKTTLLKDLFADMIVQQATNMCTLENKFIKGKDLYYYDKATIGLLPNNIADCGILVASSNNGAVQNIVKDIPLFKDVDAEFIDEIEKVDYFIQLANSKVNEEWKNSTKVIDCKQIDDKNKNWGLLSLEGGTSTNMNNICNCIELIIKYFDSGEYIANSNVYNEFKKQREKVCNIRLDAVQYYTDIKNYAESKNKLDNLTKESKEISDHKVERLNLLNHDIEVNKKEIELLEKSINELGMDYEDIKERYNGEEKTVDNIMQNKPFFIFFKARKEYASKLAIAEERRIDVLKNRNIISDSLKKLKRKEECIRHEIMAIRKELKFCEKDFDEKRIKNEKNIENINDIIFDLEEKIKKYKLNPLDMLLDYEELQLSTPWFDEDYRREQSRLFIMSLKVRKQFLYENKKNLHAAINIWRNQGLQVSKDNGKQLLRESWNWINLCIPIIGTTFASFGRMTKNLDIECIGNLFIDEAGQALPQACVGGLLKSKNVLVVGDPYQIKPVLTLESKMVSILAKHYKITENFISADASVQKLVDYASQYGYWKSESEWIGIPLWVHRRCLNPMFEISNMISYNGNMVQAQTEVGKAYWYDIKGIANDKYVDEQGSFLVKTIEDLIRKNPNIKDNIFVISPFSNVARMLAKKLDEIKFTKRDNINKKIINVGTVHTFQGKEADIVFFVLGADEHSKGAANWAVSDSEIMNVAVTRAKKEFYIIGDKELYKNLKTPVILNTCSILDKYNMK